mmetsp:Transcript_18664/g.52512  ORF Transcript_18664/g.52512 Transcript_18664/m.52512 type:complete len:305 (-) Transcript_18664:429-1343(-)
MLWCTPPRGTACLRACNWSARAGPWLQKLCRAPSTHPSLSSCWGSPVSSVARSPRAATWSSPTRAASARTVWRSTLMPSGGGRRRGTSSSRCSLEARGSPRRLSSLEPTSWRTPSRTSGSWPGWTGRPSSPGTCTGSGPSPCTLRATKPNCRSCTSCGPPCRVCISRATTWEGWKWELWWTPHSHSPGRWVQASRTPKPPPPLLSGRKRGSSARRSWQQRERGKKRLSGRRGRQNAGFGPQTGSRRTWAGRTGRRARSRRSPLLRRARSWGWRWTALNARPPRRRRADGWQRRRPRSGAWRRRW